MHRPLTPATPYPRLDHLRRLVGPFGMYEHANLRQPRVGHGYTVDDNARALIVTGGRSGAEDIFDLALDFVVDGYSPAGWHNRMDCFGNWTDTVGSEDAHGRAVWGLGTAAGLGLLDNHERALAAMDGWHLRTLSALRAASYAALGGAAASRGRDSAAGDAILAGYQAPELRTGSWPWPEDRLTYDNARVPEAMIAAGTALGAPDLVDRGLALLDWLADTEEIDGMYAFTPVAGRGPGDPRRPGFDQQPLEAWAMADACRLAGTVTGDTIWRERLAMAVEWFSGRNHVGVALFDPLDGAGYDGLEASGVNRNAGAESTLALHGAFLALSASAPI